MKREIHQCECAQRELICLSPQVLGDCKVDKVVLMWFSTISIPFFFFSMGFALFSFFFLFQAQSSHPCIFSHFFSLMLSLCFSPVLPNIATQIYNPFHFP